MAISISRVPGFTTELQDKYGVQIMRSPQEVAELCDLIFILTCDGRIHPALFKLIAKYGKPVFLDKPFAVSRSDADVIFKLANEAGIRVFGASAFRYTVGLIDALNHIRLMGERIETCEIRYWLQIQETQGRYYWYGIHASEMLLATMGTGIESVEATSDDGHDYISVCHKDGRKSRLIGSTTDGTFSVKISTDKQVYNIDLEASMATMSSQILWAALDILTEGKFPKLWNATNAGSISGNRPSRSIDPSEQETMEVIELLDAAQRSFQSKNREMMRN